MTLCFANGTPGRMAYGFPGRWVRIGWIISGVALILVFALWAATMWAQVAG